MINTCHAAGVKVIVGEHNILQLQFMFFLTSFDADTIFNHMAGVDSGTGVAGSPFTHYVYNGIYQNQVRFFPHSSYAAWREWLTFFRLLTGFPSLWSDAWRWHRRLYQPSASANMRVGEPCWVSGKKFHFWRIFLTTTPIQFLLYPVSPPIRNTFVKDWLHMPTTCCLSVPMACVWTPLNVSFTHEIWFFRWPTYELDDIDIAASDLANILGRLTSKPYITQEVIFGAGEAVQPSEYVGNGVFYCLWN